MIRNNGCIVPDAARYAPSNCGWHCVQVTNLPPLTKIIDPLDRMRFRNRLGTVLEAA